MVRPTHNFEQLADRVGQIDEIIAQLEVERNRIKSLFAKHDVIEVDGKRFHVSLSNVRRKNVRWKDLAMSMKPSRQRIQAYTDLQFFTQMKATERED